MTLLAVSGFAFVAVTAAPLQFYASRGHRLSRPCAMFVSVCRNVILIVGLFLLMSAEGVSPSRIGIGFASGYALLGGAIVATIAVVGLDLATTRLLVADSQARSRAIRQLESRVPRDTFERTLFCLLAVVAAVWEELAFRGSVLYVADLWSIPTSFAVAVGALVFGAQHVGGGSSSVIYSSLMGAIFFVLYLCLGNIVPVIVAHCAGNLFVVFRTYPLLLSADAKTSGGSLVDQPIIPL